jgi:hypothetical protein
MLSPPVADYQQPWNFDPVNFFLETYWNEFLKRKFIPAVGGAVDRLLGPSWTTIRPLESTATSQEALPKRLIEEFGSRDKSLESSIEKIEETRTDEATKTDAQRGVRDESLSPCELSVSEQEGSCRGVDNRLLKCETTIFPPHSEMNSPVEQLTGLSGLTEVQSQNPPAVPSEDPAPPKSMVQESFGRPVDAHQHEPDGTTINQPQPKPEKPVDQNPDRPQDPGPATVPPASTEVKESQLSEASKDIDPRRAFNAEPAKDATFQGTNANKGSNSSPSVMEIHEPTADRMTLPSVKQVKSQDSISPSESSINRSQSHEEESLTANQTGSIKSLRIENQDAGIGNSNPEIMQLALRHAESDRKFWLCLGLGALCLTGAVIGLNYQVKRQRHTLPPLPFNPVISLSSDSNSVALF